MQVPAIAVDDDDIFLPWLPGDVWRKCDCGCRVRRFFCGTGLEHRAEKSLDKERCRGGGEMLIMGSSKKCTLHLCAACQWHVFNGETKLDRWGVTYGSVWRVSLVGHGWPAPSLLRFLSADGVAMGVSPKCIFPWCGLPDGPISPFS